MKPYFIKHKNLNRDEKKKTYDIFNGSVHEGIKVEFLGCPRFFSRVLDVYFRLHTPFEDHEN